MPDLAFKIRIKHFTFSIDILAIPFIIIALLSDFTLQYFITMGFIIAHELGHIVAALISGAGIYCFKILPIGVTAAIDDCGCSKCNKIFIYLTGPCVNIAFVAIIYFLYACHIVNIELTSGIYINIWLAFFNLLPILPLDGGKIVLEVLSDYSGLFRTFKVMNAITVLLAITTIILGLIILIQTQYNASLVLIGIYILLYRTDSRKETALMNIKNLLFRRSRIMKQRIFPVREIVVMKDVTLSEVIKAMDHANRFHIIYVLDENLRIIKAISEQEVLDAVMTNTIDTTIDKLLTNINPKR